MILICYDIFIQTKYWFDGHIEDDNWSEKSFSWHATLQSHFLLPVSSCFIIVVVQFESVSMKRKEKIFCNRIGNIYSINNSFVYYWSTLEMIYSLPPFFMLQICMSSPMILLSMYNGWEQLQFDAIESNKHARWHC